MPKRIYYPQCGSDDERRAAKQFAQSLTERPDDVLSRMCLEILLVDRFKWSPERLSRFVNKWLAER